MPTSPALPDPAPALFAGPKAENGDWFADAINRIVLDYHAWRRNYFPEDGVVVDSAARRASEPLHDAFQDRLIELLARLKHDVPFHSPRYAGHMIAEQSLPGIAGYFAAMLYNPNNVSPDSAPVTVRLELEAARMIARMLGHPDDGWAHLTSGGTIANIEALWLARSVRYLPFIVRDARRTLGLTGSSPPGPLSDRALLGVTPGDALSDYAHLFDEAAHAFGPSPHTVARVEAALLQSRFHVGERGVVSVMAALDSTPVLLVPETHHYCFEKALDVLGIGRAGLVPVRVDSQFRMIIDDLRRKLDDIDASGRHVLAVVAVVGTTEEGAIDPVHEIVALRAEREAAGHPSFWIHADAAYGGYLRSLTQPSRAGLGPPRTSVHVGGVEHEISLTLPEHQACDALERLGECDSITIDPHKLGYVPYPAGCVCFRSNLVKPLARQHAPYFAEDARGPEEERNADTIGVYILEGSKPGAAAAAVWLSHSLIPLDTTGHGVLVRHTIRSAAELHALLHAYPDLLRNAGHEPPPVRAVCLCPPGSNIVCYAFLPADPAVRFSLAQLNAANAAIYRRFSPEAGRRVYDQSFFISRTTLSANRYAADTISDFLQRFGVSGDHYHSHGVFLLRSVLMNPWYDEAKRRGRFFLSELVAALYQTAAEELGLAPAPAPAGTPHPARSPR